MKFRTWTCLLAVLALILQAGLVVRHGTAVFQPAAVAATTADAAATPSSAFDAGSWIICSARGAASQKPGQGGGHSGKVPQPCPICAALTLAWVPAAAAAILAIPTPTPDRKLPAVNVAVRDSRFWLSPPNRGPPTLSA